MTNLLEQAINSNDGDHAARLIQEALGIESDEVVNYCFPKAWPNDPSSALGSLSNGCSPFSCLTLASHLCCLDAVLPSAFTHCFARTLPAQPRQNTTDGARLDTRDQARRLSGHGPARRQKGPAD